MQYSTITEGMQHNPPATDNLILSVESQLNLKFPLDYRRFLKYSNGIEGDIGETNYLRVWPIDELSKHNMGYRVQEFMPDAILIATDAGGTAFGYDIRQKSESQWCIYEVPFVPLSWEEAIRIAPNFDLFIKRLSSE